MLQMQVTLLEVTLLNFLGLLYVLFTGVLNFFFLGLPTLVCH